MEIIGRAEARAAGLVRYFTGKPCKRGHVTERFVTSGGCATCARENASRRYSANPEMGREATRRWQKENAEKVRQSILRRDKEKLREKARVWRAENPEKARDAWRKQRASNVEAAREASRRWSSANPERCRFHASKRRSAKLQRTPAWADLSTIASFYAACPPGYHVDHIEPLQGADVCGLHVIENLQYLPAVENLRKGNRREAT